MKHEDASPAGPGYWACPHCGAETAGWHPRCQACHGMPLVHKAYTKAEAKLTRETPSEGVLVVTGVAGTVRCEFNVRMPRGRRDAVERLLRAALVLAAEQEGVR